MTTAGEGGMVTTNDEELFRKMNSIRNHGRPNSQLGVYEHDRFGLNLQVPQVFLVIFLYVYQPVSYTHLTLPTNREV